MSDESKEIHSRRTAHDAGGQPGLTTQATAGEPEGDPLQGDPSAAPKDVIDGHEDGLANDALDQGGNKEGGA